MTDVTSDDGNHIWRRGRGWVPINEDAEVAKDALIRELMDGRHRDLDKMREMKAMIRELVTALEHVRDWRKANWRETNDKPDQIVNAALAKAKEAGY